MLEKMCWSKQISSPINMSNIIKHNLEKVNKEIDEFQARLVCVTKYATIDQIESLYKHGERQFGENKVQDIKKKSIFTQSDIQWHLIGHLQSNKVQKAVEHYDVIQSVDSLKILKNK